MALKRFVQEQRQIILHIEGMICSTPHQLLESKWQINYCLIYGDAMYGK
jgi:hypothetical protein